MKSWYELDLGVDQALTVDLKDYCLSNPEREGVTQMWIPGHGGVWLLDQETLFAPKWLEEVKKATGLSVTGALVFFRAAGYQHPRAHIDIEPVEDGGQKKLLPVSAAYNWVLEPTDAEMVWYEPWWDADNYDECLKAAQNQADFDSQEVEDLEYNEIDPARLEELERHQLSHDCLTIVRTNIPHNVHMGTKDRWCISARAFESTPGLWSTACGQLEGLIRR